MDGKDRPTLTTGIQYSHDLVTHHDQLSAVSEAFKIARTNIEFSSIDKRLRSLMVTSSNQTEGKTVTLSNLAIAYAQMGRKVLLVDADLRRPAVHRYFGYVNRRGLTNVLIGAGHYRDFVLPTLTENLSILPAGPIPPNPADLLMSQTMTDLIEALEGEFDLVLVDCPPVGAVTDAAIVSTKVDATIFVVRAGQTNKHQLKRSVALLEQVNARVLGFVMNGVSEESDDYYYYYYQYYQADPSADEASHKHFATSDKKKHKHGKSEPAPAAKGFHAAPLVRQTTVPSTMPGALSGSQPGIQPGIQPGTPAGSMPGALPPSPPVSIPTIRPGPSAGQYPYADPRSPERSANVLRHFISDEPIAAPGTRTDAKPDASRGDARNRLISEDD